MPPTMGLYPRKQVNRMATKTNNNVSANRIEKLVAFVRTFNANENRGCPVGAIEYVGGFSKNEIKAAKTAGMIVSGKGSEGGFYPAGMKPVAKGPVVKATVKNQMAAFLRSLHTGVTITPDMTSTVSRLLAEYDAQNAKRRKE